MLTIAKREPEWIEALGARFLFAPISWPMVRRARKAARAARGDGEASDEEAAERLASMSDAISLALLSEGLLDWEGVGDADGAPLACSSEAKAVALADPAVFEALDDAYVLPFSLRQIEGNGSAPSPSGTGGAPTPASDIAATAPTPPAAGAAANAPTTSTRRTATARSRPGKR